VGAELRRHAAGDEGADTTLVVIMAGPRRPGCRRRPSGAARRRWSCDGVTDPRGQVLTTLPFRRASAYASRELAMRDDDSDDRRRTRFTVVAIVDAHPDDITAAWKLAEFPSARRCCAPRRSAGSTSARPTGVVPRG